MTGPDFFWTAVRQSSLQKISGLSLLNEKMKIIDFNDLRRFHQPKPRSHKGDNGRLLIIAGSEQYHGAALLAATVASKIVDLVYFSSVPENNQLVQKMKSRLIDTIVVPRSKVEEYVRKSDVVLIGPGLGVSDETKELVNRLLRHFRRKRFVLDADAFKVVDKRLLSSKCVVTPHRGEFRLLFGVQPSAQAALRAARCYGCVVVLKGSTDYVATSRGLWVNRTGNAGMTKGGTGDVLAGLIAALACTNSLKVAAIAGVYVNGLAGDRLHARRSWYFSASDLAGEIPKTLQQIVRS